VLTEPTPNVQTFFQAYRTAFERSDAAGIAGRFAYPSHITSDTDEIVLMPLATEHEWIGQIEQLLSTYRRIGVSSARVLGLAATELSPRLLQAVLHWALHDAAGDLLYRFEATYTLAEIDGALRITALAHNELPRLRECLARQQSRD
jgi:hypothetical protein